MRNLRLLIKLKPQRKANQSFRGFWGFLQNFEDSFFLRREIEGAIKDEKEEWKTKHS